MAEKLPVKQGTIVCQVCGKMIEAVESQEGVNVVWEMYGRLFKLKRKCLK